MIKGQLTINLDRKVDECNKRFDDLIEECDELQNLTQEQKNRISDCFNSCVLNEFSDFKLDVLASE